MTANLSAILFDMDGVLVDSEPLWRKAEIQVFAKYGITLTDNMCRGTKGKRLDAVVAHWLEHFERPELDGEAIEEALPGVVETLALCRRLKCPWNIATSSNLRLARAALTRLGIWDEVSDRVVTGDQVVNPKPAPEIFIEAARRLEVEPTACLVIEDSTHGCVAGKRAGATVLVVPEVGVSTEGLFGEADFIRARLEADFVESLLAGV
jgi:sugar-phosphatase